MNNKSFWTTVVVSYVVVIIIASFLFSCSTKFLGSEWNWGLLLILATILHFVGSWKTVGPDEWGLRLLFRDPFDQVSSGLVFVPAVFFTLETVTKLLIEVELPGDPEKIYRAPKDDTSGIVPEGKVPPIRITFGPPKKTDDLGSDNPLHNQMTQEVDIVLWYKIVDYVKFRTTIGSQEEAHRQMEDLAVAMLTEKCAHITPAVALMKLKSLSKQLRSVIDKKTKTWGIYLDAAKVKGINIDRTLNETMINVPKSKEAARIIVTTAQAEKTKRKLEGEGDGLAEKAKIDGRTNGLKKMMTDLGIKSGETVLAAETARGITQNPGSKTIIAGSQGFSDLARVGAVLGETFKDGGQK